MAVNRSVADILAEWDALLIARQEGILPSSARLDRIAKLRERATELQAEQAFHEARRRVLGAAFNALLREGMDEARDVQAELRGALGHRSELLVTYGLKPLREGRRRRARPPAEPPSGEPGLGGPAST